MISGGGTGGHIFPAVAIANALKSKYPDAEFLFVGASDRMEMEKVPAAGYSIVGLEIRGIRRKFSLENLSLPFVLAKALRKAGKLIQEFKPDVAIGVGGYASGALLYMASRKGVPCLIQEQNSFAGITNKLLGKRVAKICVAYDGMDAFFPKEKLVITGNPVRKEILDAASSTQKHHADFGLDASKFTLLVVGGSLGAKSINESILQSLPALSKAGIQLIWQTGKPFESQAEEALKSLGNSGFKSFGFIQDMDKAYSCADLVVSRAGALAVAELAILGKASILVPYPFAAEDHQTMNAKALSDKGAAVLIPDARAKTDLEATLVDLIRDNQKRLNLAGKILAFGKPNATEAIVEQVEKLMTAKR